MQLAGTPIMAQLQLLITHARVPSGTRLMVLQRSNLSPTNKSALADLKFPHNSRVVGTRDAELEQSYIDHPSLFASHAPTPPSSAQS